MRILFSILTCIILVENKIIIEDANIAAVSHDDIGMIFYIALHNTDSCGYRIYTRMIRCVEEVEAADRECEMMQLLGGDMGEIKSQCYKNITLLYPNMYLHNRKGYCIIAIKFISEDNQVLEKKTNISFNTYIGTKNRVHLTNGVDKTMGRTSCESVDLDPFQNCAPVDCHMKYLGTRSFFNRKWKRCQKVPVCVYDIEKDLPDVGYTPITNKCIDLERCIKKSDLQPLENKYQELGEDNSYSLMLTAINCHNGRINNETGLCDCNPGWSSANFDKEPTLFSVHMCNIELSSWYDTNRSEITFVAFVIAVMAVAIAMAVVLVSFILFQIWKCLSNNEDKKAMCYCDLESGMEPDDSSKKNKKGDKSVKKTPSAESKESKDTNESKKNKKPKKSKSEESAKTDENVDSKTNAESTKAKKKLSKVKQTGDSETKPSTGNTSKTSISVESVKKENKKKRSKTEAPRQTISILSTSKKGSRDKVVGNKSTTSISSGKQKVKI
ncbi:hypothetical protein MML48_1g04614 [Holotrichia oblita]|uniref:Uncharacterized protein n=1 Tax=Holotrichia oblita TaxID=644536 RepID=A0ACB9TTV9_HOLOL|nr:hypothetical protein MML48_1g04614 [Holotrichia oblita]